MLQFNWCGARCHLCGATLVRRRCSASPHERHPTPRRGDSPLSRAVPQPQRAASLKLYQTRIETLYKQWYPRVTQNNEYCWNIWNIKSTIKTTIQFWLFECLVFEKDRFWQCNLVFWVCFVAEVDALSVFMRFSANICIYEQTYIWTSFDLLWYFEKADWEYW